MEKRYWLSGADREEAKNAVRHVNGLTEVGVRIPTPALPSRGGGAGARYFLLAEDAFGCPVSAFKAEMGYDGTLHQQGTETFDLWFVEGTLNGYPHFAKEGYGGVYGVDEQGQAVFLTGPCIPPSCDLSVGSINISGTAFNVQRSGSITVPFDFTNMASINVFIPSSPSPYVAWRVAGSGSTSQMPPLPWNPDANYEFVVSGNLGAVGNTVRVTITAMSNENPPCQKVINVDFTIIADGPVPEEP